jgi:hypothetical protein
VNARRNSFENGITIVVRQVSAAVEQRAVDIDADQSNHAENTRKPMPAGRWGKPTELR